MTETHLPYRSFVGSRPFNLLVGPQKERFYVHAELLASCSQYFTKLVHGPMKEAEDRLAELNDVEVETFVRFVEYLYTKDYAVPEPDIVLTSSDIASGTVEDSPALENACEPVVIDDSAVAESVWGSWGSTSRSVHGKKARRIAKQIRRLAERSESPCPVQLEGVISPQRKHRSDIVRSAFEEKAYVQEKESWEPRPNSEICEDYTQVLLCHARLYRFSDKHGIEQLRDLTLQKLRLTLTRFNLFEQRVPDIVELLRYTYAHTMEHDQGIDELRSLVMDYVVCNLEMMVENSDFLELLTQAGALAKDLVLKSVQILD